MKKHRRTLSIWKLLGGLAFVLVVCLFAPAISPEFEAKIKDGTTIPLFGCQNNPIAEIFGISPVYGKSLEASGYWDCSCTWWEPPNCSGTARRYESGKLVSSWFSSCTGGIDQDGRSCKGCCFRTECTWMKTDNPPAISVSILCALPGANGWCIGGAQANVSASDPDGDSISVSCSNPSSSGTGTTPLPEGTGTKSCTVIANGESRSDSAAWKVDGTNPTVSFSVSGTSGSGGWYTSAPTVTISGSDATSGVASAVLSTGGSSTTISSEGTVTLFGTVTDNAGNSDSKSVTVSYDGTPPSISMDVSGSTGAGGWYTSVPVISVSGSDAVSGVASAVLSSGGNPSTITTEGTSTITGTVTDNAGNSSSQLVTVSYDANPPRIIFDVAGDLGTAGWYTSAPTVTGSGSDSGAGLASVALSSGGTSTTITSEGSTTLTATASDNAGRTSTQTITVRYDATPPNVSLDVTGNLGAGGWYISSPTVTVNGSDAISGIDSLVLSVGGSSTTITTEGSTTISGTATDAAGLTSTTSTTVLYDGTDPTIAPNIAGTVVNGAYHPTVTLSVNASDAVSGISSERVQIDEGGWTDPGTFTLTSGPHTIEFQATDHAGLTTSSSQTINVDSGSPAVSISVNGCSSTVTFSGFASDDNGVADVSFSIDGSTYSAKFGGGTWEYTVNGLASGMHTASVTATDTFGNISTAGVGLKGDAEKPTVSMGGMLTHDTATALRISDNYDLSKVRVHITVDHEGDRIFNQTYSGTDYPGVISWGVLIPRYRARYGDELVINVRAIDACGNAGVASAVMSAVQPTSTPTTLPTATPESKPTVIAEQLDPTLQPTTPTPMPTLEPETVIAAFVGFWDWAWMLVLMIGCLVLASNQLADPRPPAWYQLAEVRKKKNQTKRNLEDK